MKQLFDHQEIGIQAIVDHPFFALFCEMGTGKSRQVIEAAQRLFILGAIDHVLIICPAAVRTTWTDPEFGQLRTWLDPKMSHEVTELHIKSKAWRYGPPSSTLFLRWTVTNYDFVRQGPSRFGQEHANAIQRKRSRFAALANLCGLHNTFLVLDESSAVKNHTSQQTKSVAKLRKLCKRVVLLNGTPVDHSPKDLFSQSNIMDLSILGTTSMVQFRSRYAIMGGFEHREIVEWRNLDDLRQRLKPYVLRRLKVDCLDLPAKLPPVTITAPLEAKTWTAYQHMRKDMIAWLTEQLVSAAPQAAVKTIRLAQLTSGYLGGVVEEGDGGEPALVELSSEKQTALLAALRLWWEENPNLKVIIWCRFRRELTRMAESLKDSAIVGVIQGGQPQDERDATIRLLDPRTAPSGPVVVVGNPKAGGLGLNLVAATTVVHLSSGYSLRDRLQADDRVHRPGQTAPVSYFDMIATGPDGQRTIDSLILKALRERLDLANWTTAAWLSALSVEESHG